MFLLAIILPAFCFLGGSGNLQLILRLQKALWENKQKNSTFQHSFYYLLQVIWYIQTVQI